MAREHRQRGQALPAVMVIMVLLSLIAGGLAIVVSGALSQQSVSRRHLEDDLTAQNGIEVAAARIQQGSCAPAGPASAPRITRTPLPGVSPAGRAPGVPDAYCLRVDGVDTTKLDRQTLTASSQTTSCMSFSIPQSGTVGIWFQVARGNLDLTYGLRPQTAATCSAGLATPSPSPSPSKGGCSKPATIQTNKNPPLTQAGFVCSLPEPATSPQQVLVLSLSLGQTLRELNIPSITLWMAPGVRQGGGSTILVAAPTGASPAYEQAQLVSTDSGFKPLQLRSEERLG